MTSLDTVRMTVDTLNSGGTVRRFSASIRSWIGFVIARLSYWNRLRVTRYELSRLSDRDLADIGLTRGDIDRLSL